MDNKSNVKDEPKHRGDPCVYCGIPHNEVEPGPCKGRVVCRDCCRFQVPQAGVIECLEGGSPKVKNQKFHCPDFYPSYWDKNFKQNDQVTDQKGGERCQ